MESRILLGPFWRHHGQRSQSIESAEGCVDGDGGEVPEANLEISDAAHPSQRFPEAGRRIQHHAVAREQAFELYEVPQRRPASRRTGPHVIADAGIAQRLQSRGIGLQDLEDRQRDQVAPFIRKETHLEQSALVQPRRLFRRRVCHLQTRQVRQRRKRVFSLPIDEEVRLDAQLLDPVELPDRRQFAVESSLFRQPQERQLRQVLDGERDPSVRVVAGEVHSERQELAQGRQTHRQCVVETEAEGRGVRRRRPHHRQGLQVVEEIQCVRVAAEVALSGGLRVQRDGCDLVDTGGRHGQHLPGDAGKPGEHLQDHLSPPPTDK